MKERLHKVIAQRGFCSRRAAEKYIAEGKVTVDGKMAQIGDVVEAETAVITVCGAPVLAAQEKMRYIMLHKPRGVVTTVKDEQNRPTVMGLIADVEERVYPVGRLDMYSEGLLLLTNDGELANRLTHPSHEIYKEYLLRIRAPKEIDPVAALSAPMQLDGRALAPAMVKKIRDEGEDVLLSVKIREGRNRQIRRMCEQYDFTVKTLKRIAVGKLKLDRLPCGKWRNLETDEIDYLKSL